ncbi:bifunctional oligoribonuclease/PAP phosphatase NrnA, partial [Candidatus Latescibacterota bacterium]
MRILIINHIRVIEGIVVALLVIQEEPLKWKISLRSLSGVRVNDIASRLGGGGHERAAGATLNGTLEEISQRTLDT